MSSAAIGSTPGASQYNTAVSAVSDVLGNIKFVGPTGLIGNVLTIVATIATAPPAAEFTALLGVVAAGSVVDTWDGSSTAGRFQIQGGQTLVVTGTNLIPSTTYICNFAGINDTGPVQVVTPDPNTSSLNALIAAQSLGTFTYPYAGSPYTLQPIPSWCCSLYIIATGSSETTAQIVGGTSGFDYYGPSGVDGASGVQSIPYSGILDPTAILTLSGGAAGETISIIAVPYDSLTTVANVPGGAFAVIFPPGEPQDVVEMGGLLTARVTSVVNTGNAEFLIAPATGKAYRLHGFLCEEVATSGIATLANAAGSIFYGAFSYLNGYAYLGGQLATTAVYAINNLGGTANFDLTYDIVDVPVIA